jgi:hypothetical protein
LAERLEAALLNSAGLIQAAGHLGAHTIQLQAYRLIYQPKASPTPITALEPDSTSPTIIV